MVMLIVDRLVVLVLEAFKVLVFTVEKVGVSLREYVTVPSVVVDTVRLELVEEAKKV